MTTIINASNSGSGGLVQTADASGVLALQTAGTTAVTVDTSQNVGIGTTSPAAKLELGSGTLLLTNNVFLQQKDSSGNAKNVAGVNASNQYSFGGLDGSSTINTIRALVAGNEAMRIDSSGNVLIGQTGVTGDGEKVSISNTTTSGSAYNTTLRLISTTTGAGSEAKMMFNLGGASTGISYISSQLEGAGYGNLIFATRPNGGNPSERMRIDSTGNVGIGTTSPSSYGLLSVVSSTAGSAKISIQDTSGGSSPAPLLQFGVNNSNGFNTADAARIWTTAATSSVANLNFSAYNNGGTSSAQMILTGGNLLVGAASASALPTGYVSVANTFGFKNRIINGALVIDQRNAGASVSGTTGVYTVDRWTVQNNSGAARFNVQQNVNSVTPPVGYKYYLGVTSTSAYTVAATDVIGIQQFIEGYNIADLGWGASGAATITFSFWVRSSLTGTFGGSIVEGAAGTAFYPFTYTISSANTWEQKTVTIAGPTIGTWNSTNGRGPQVLFNLGTGSTYIGTAGAWTANSYYAATGATNFVATNGATFYITGVQLEKGSTATSFDYRPYGTELQLCQRYFISYGGTTGYERFGVGMGNGATTASICIALPVPMRVAPTLGYSAVGDIGLYDGANVITATVLAFDQPSEKVLTVAVTVASGGTQYRPMALIATNNTSARLRFSAEL